MTRHQGRWAQRITDQLRYFLSELQFLIRVDLRPSFYLRPNDTVYLNVPKQAFLSRACQVIEVSHNMRGEGEITTQVLLRTL